jgi:hypothetical protein
MTRFGALVLLLGIALAQSFLSVGSTNGDILRIDVTKIKIDLEELTVLPEQVRSAGSNNRLMLQSAANFSKPVFPPLSFPAFYELPQTGNTIRLRVGTVIPNGWRIAVNVGTGDTPSPWLTGSLNNTYLLDSSQVEIKADSGNWSKLSTTSQTIVMGSGQTNGLSQSYQLGFRLQVRGGEIPDCYKTTVVFSLINNATGEATLALPVPLEVCIPKVNTIALSNSVIEFDLNKSNEAYPPIPPRKFEDVSYLPTNLDPTKPTMLWFFSNIPGNWRIIVKGDNFTSTDPTKQTTIPVSIFQYCIKPRGDETPCAEEDWKPFSASTQLGTNGNGVSLDFPFYRIWYRLKLTGSEPMGQYQATLIYTLAQF